MSSSTKKPQSPFLDVSSFAAEETEILSEQEEPSSMYNTPFRSVYELEGQEDRVDPEAEELASFLTGLHDSEFDEAVFEIVNEVADLYESRFHGEYEELAAQRMKAERLLQEHFTPLAKETEALLEALAEYVEHRDPNSLSESEIDDFINRYNPRTELSPSFENLFGNWISKIRKVAKKGLDLAKRGIKAASKLGLGPILLKLKALINPLLKKVLQVAIGKLPAQLQPIAKGLAQRFLKEVEEEAQPVEGEDAAGDITRIQYEFDLQLANLLYTDEEAEQEVAVAEYITAAEHPALNQLDQLEHARSKFINQISQLKEGEDPTPAVEEFVNTILPTLKLGISLTGRKRVVDFLAKLLAKLIGKFVGPQYTPALSQAIVDAGLRLINLEATPDDEKRVALDAVTDTVEETVRWVAAFPEYILDNDELLEGFVLEAFESVAAAELPPVLPHKVYQERPDLRETIGISGTWVRQPLRGKKYFEKYTQVFKVNITPHMAGTVETWSGVPLAMMIQDLYGIPGGRTIKARVHLYKAVPGTCWLSRISKYEKGITGLGTPAKLAWSKIQPLTPQAAAIILGQPRLGRTVSVRYLANPLMISTGQRFYYLEIPDVSTQMLLVPGAPSMARRCCQTHLILDFPRDQIRISIFLSEAHAQKMAMKLRQRAPMGPIMTSLRQVFAAGLKTAFSEGMYHQVKIIHGAMAIEQFPAKALKWLPQIVQEMLVNNLMEWVGQSLNQYLQQRAQDFIKATEDLATGLTIVVRLNSPPGLVNIRRILAGEPIALRSMRFPGDMPEAQVQIVPGYLYE